MTADAIPQRTPIQIPRFYQRKGEAAKETVAAPLIHQAAFQQCLMAITEPRQITTQTGAGGVANAHSFDDGVIVDSASGQIGTRLIAPCQLPLIETVSRL